MKGKYLLPVLLAMMATTACLQDPEAPMNQPELPTLTVDESSLTRVSMVVNGTLGKNMEDVTGIGVEISETLFEDGGTYKSYEPQEVNAGGFSLGVTDLTFNSTYFLRAYITNGYSRLYSSTITQKTPESSVASISDVTIKDNYYLVATIEDNGGRSVEDVGFLWSTSSERKDIKREKRYVGTLSADGKTFTLPLSEVGEGTHYILAYAEDDKDGTGYSRIPFEYSLKGEDEAQIEDPNFKKYLLLYHDANEDGKFTYAELKQVEFIDVHTDNIKSVREIDQMPLKSLLVNGTQARSGQLTSLNVSRNTALLSIDCSNNNLKELDASMIPGLEYLNCEGNPMETLYLSYYQKFNELLYPEGCKIVYVDAPEPPAGQPNNEIWYTSVDGNVVEPYKSDAFNTTIISNTYEDGIGKLVFDGPLTKIGNAAFFNSPLLEITLPDSVEEIAENAFWQEPAHWTLQAFYGKGASEDHLSLVSNGVLVAVARKDEKMDFVIPENVTKVGWNVFYSCRYRTVTIPAGLKSCDYGFLSMSDLEAFYGPNVSEDHRCIILNGVIMAFAAKGLTSYTLTESLDGIGSHAFYNQYSSLKELVLPDTATSIGTCAFSLTPITSLTLPAHLKSIATEAFFAMYSLPRITIPAEVESIGSEAFSYAGDNYGGLTDITFLSTTPPVIKEDTFVNLIGDGPFYVPAQSVQAYKTAQYWSAYADRIQSIPADITASKYLTFTSEGITKISLSNNGGNAPVVYYSYDAQNWTQWNYSELSFSQDSPLYIFGNNPDGFSTANSLLEFKTAGDLFSVSGSIMSLLDGNEDLSVIPSAYCFSGLFANCANLTAGPALPATTLTEGCYQAMYMDCVQLNVAPELPAMELANNCYRQMFENCRSLTSAPVLPAQKALYGCYQSMFEGCVLLSEAPVLPAETMEGYCYAEMFSECTSLVSAPALPATALSYYCYNRMFYHCTSLENAPDLPATSLLEYCYQSMFTGCTKLTEAPALPATVLSVGCYANMFEGCTSLSVAHELPATTLAKDCYNKMFSGCTSLISAPALPATTMEEYCYYSMFESCTSLVAAPELPATSLARFCYDSMFLKCSELSSIPVLPAQTLVQGCYAYMFSECGKLSFVTCLATDISAADCTTCWLAEVASTGTFVKSSDMNDWTTGISGIPEGWNVVNNGDVPNGGNEGTGEEPWN